MNKATKLIIATSIVALLGAGCAPRQPSPPAVGTSQNSVAAGTMTVKILPDGEFDPVTAFVKKGTVLAFQNASDEPHSIVPQDDASERFDGLNSKGDIIPGGKFSVTMDKAGRWLYSDGTNPAFGGAVIVSE